MQLRPGIPRLTDLHKYVKENRDACKRQRSLFLIDGLRLLGRSSSLLEIIIVVKLVNNNDVIF